VVCNINLSCSRINQLTQSVKHEVHHLWAKVLHVYRWINDAALGILLRNHHWVLHPRTYAAKAHAYAIKFFTRDKTTLHSCSRALPTLPIPALQRSVDKYLLSIQPFVNPEQLAAIQTRSRYFVAEEGAELQAKLIKETEGKRDWFEETWLNAAYLENRFSALHTAWYGMDSVVPSTNDYAMPEVDRAARIVYLSLKFGEMIRAGTLSPLEGEVPICMHQFDRIFGANRSPGEVCDTLEVHAHSKHIMILVKGKVFTLEVLDSKGAVHNEEQIMQGFRKIYHTALSSPNGDNVAALSLQDRTNWARDKQALAEENHENLTAMDTALLAVRISDKAPANDKELAEGLYLNENDLYIDKGITLTAFANGKIGGTMEHTMADATIVSKMFEWAYQHEAYMPGYHKGNDASAIQVTELKWKLSPQLQSSIAKSKLTTAGFMSQVDLECAVFDGFGKNTIQRYGCNPDSFVQMAMQLAYKKLHQKAPFTYESASTRLFYHGRTETIRTTSVESELFCQAMRHKQLTKADKRLALKDALKAHVKYKREAAAGMGCDRHLLALRRLAGEEKYRFFEQEDFNKSYDLATSQTPVKYAKGGGFGPSSMEGYGVCYHLYPDHIRLNISKYKSNEITAKMMADAIVEAMKEMKALYE
jgi:hypothetical protein